MATQKELEINGSKYEVIAEKNGIQLLRVNVERKTWKAPRYWYWIIYDNEEPRAVISYTAAKSEFDFQSKFPIS